MGASTVLLSAHLDDGVMSAAGRLMQPDTTLLTVFAGVPDDDLGLSVWDRFTGASSSRQRQLDRRAEDAEAASVLGCTLVHWDEMEWQYRPYETGMDRDAIVADICAVVEPAAEIWVPAGIGGHPDHLLVRDLALAACRNSSSLTKVRLYADLPYSLKYGWPAWVTGVTPQQYLDVGFWIDDELRQRGIDPAVLKANSIRLDADSRSRKQRAVSAYRTQLPALGVECDWDDLLDYEVWWEWSRDDDIGLDTWPAT